MGASYLAHLAQCGDLIEGAYEVLSALHGKSRIAIVTNGLKIVQRTRLERSRIRAYIDVLVISEEVGAAKPNPEYFEAVCDLTGQPLKSDVLIIGDSLTSDIQGGRDFGIDTCWYNPAGEARHELLTTYQISSQAIYRICWINRPLHAPVAGFPPMHDASQVFYPQN
jgi:putative hydrolase of the HAD superfamily